MLWRRKPKLPKPRPGAWFVPVRWSYLPCTWQGWLTYVPFIAYLWLSFSYIGSISENWGQVSINLVPYWVAAAVVVQWFASHKS
jgi:hypothetical protein